MTDEAPENENQEFEMQVRCIAGAVLAGLIMFGFIGMGALLRIKGFLPTSGEWLILAPHTLQFCLIRSCIDMPINKLSHGVGFVLMAVATLIQWWPLPLLVIRPGAWCRPIFRGTLISCLLLAALAMIVPIIIAFKTFQDFG